MAWIKVGFAIAGEKQVSRAFEDFAVMTGSLEEPLDRMADVVLASVREQFETEGASGLGAKWTPLDAAYKAWKERHFPGRPILVRTGGMKGGALNKRMSVKVTHDSMVYEPKGKAGELLSYHQSGHPGGEDHPALPQRKVVALTTAQKREAVDRTFSQWIHEQKVAAGLAGPGSAGGKA